MEEIWKSVVGYEGLYQVSNFGSIRRVKSGKGTLFGRLQKKSENRYGYITAHLHKDGKGKTELVHRIVAMAFLGSAPTPKHEVNHKNSLRWDNRVENLEWVTRSENMIHAVRIGLKSNKGSRNSQAKLNWDQVREIRRLASKGMRGYQIHKLFDVSLRTIHGIMRNESWREV